MYTREMGPAPDYPVKNGKACFGSFNGAFGHFDIRGMKRPFGDLPLPVSFTNLRIMETLRFLFCDSENIGEIEIFNSSFFGFMETTLWNRKTGRRIAYRRIIPPGLTRIPRSFLNSVTACRSHRRYVRIHSRMQKSLIHVDFDFLGDSVRPPCEGRLEMNPSEHEGGECSFLVPYEVRRRCQGSYMATGPLHGWISTGYDDRQISADLGVGFFDVRKTYLPLRSKSSTLVGMGRINGKLVSFHLANSLSRDDYRYNDNVLFIDGRAWPLPPVKITRPWGVTGDWIIQDTESMIDLVFTPISDSSRALSALIVRTMYHTVYGAFDGVLLTGEGERVVLKNFPGIGKKVLLRI